MARARGANAVMALAFPPTYGAIPTTGYHKMAFSSANLGDEQGLVASDLLGYGRNPLAPSDDVVNNEGDVNVPVDLRLFGFWLKLLFGPPATSQGVAATGTLTFSAQPAASSTITVAGQAFTFKASNPVANDILIGATLADTVRNAVWALNASAVAGVAAASYSTDRTAAAITVTHDALGTGGNAFTIVASGPSNATASGATLAGGSATGPYRHVFTSGAVTLPDAVIEIGMPDADTPTYSANYGAMGNSLAIAMQRSGLLSAVINVIAQGERPATNEPEDDAPGVMAVERFAQASGAITYAGVPLGEIVSGQVNFSNNLDKAENIREDGRIDGADPGMITITPQIVARFASRILLDVATSKAAIDATFGWRLGAGKSLTFRHPALRLPKPKLPITGPGGIQATFGGQGQQDVTGKALVVTLVNDVPDYD